MHRIVYYVTDHGFGHATRAIALIRHLQHKHAVLIRNDSTHDIFKQSLGSCEIIGGRTDAGPLLLDGRLDMDECRTNLRFMKWMEQFGTAVEKEAEFLKRNSIDLIISDISCMPFLAAKRAGIRSIGISNFTWADILNHFANRDSELVSRLEEAYSCADFAIELPGTCGLRGFGKKTRSGLLCREISESRSSVRRILGIGEDEVAVFLTFGGSAMFDVSAQAPSNYRIVVPSSLQYGGNATRIPPSYYETQNIVNAMDAVVSKAGYGVFSECMQAGVPLLMACKSNSIEDAELSRLAAEHSMGMQCTLESILDGGVFNRVTEAMESASNRGARMENGNINCAEIIDSLLR